jgi:hypothetical protein
MNQLFKMEFVRHKINSVKGEIFKAATIVLFGLLTIICSLL